MIHELKTYPEHFEKAILGEKKAEYRLNDRDYHVGDYLALNEYTEEEGYTGRSALFHITDMLDNDLSPVPLLDEYVILSIHPCYFGDIDRSLSVFNPNRRPTITSRFRKEEETK